jgi:DNA recombination protein RmuC
MDLLLIVAVVVLLALLAGVIALWRSAVAAAQTRDREQMAQLAEAQTQAALGDEARRALAAAQAERSAAADRAAASEAKAAAALGELEAMRQGRDDLVRQAGEARQRADEAAARWQAADTARSALVAEVESARQRLTEAAARIAGLGADLAKRDGERDALAQRLADSEAARGAAQAALAAALAAQAEQKSRLTEAAGQIERLRADLDAAVASERTARAGLDQAAALAAERQLAHDQARDLLATQLRALTQQLYDEQGKAMLGEGRQQLEQTLSPFRDRLLELQARIDQIHAADLKDRASLHSDLQAMLAAQSRLSAEAEQLGRALRADSKAQGAWGELTLQRLLEASQLERGLAYDLQVAVRSDDGQAGRPDAVVFLPDRKALAIDAKVSLTAFIRATNAASDAERAVALAEHLASVRSHMRGLAMRDYPEAITGSLKGHALDLTLLFMPSEAAFAAAVTQDGELWAEALKQRIIIVSPTTLLATLRVVAQIWRVERQNHNAAAIAKEAGGILEKLRGALDDFDAVEQAIQKTQDAFAKARGKLVSGKGNIIRKAERILRLGAPAKDETRARLIEDGEDEDDGGDSAPSA